MQGIAFKASEIVVIISAVFPYLLPFEIIMMIFLIYEESGELRHSLMKGEGIILGIPVQPGSTQPVCHRTCVRGLRSLGLHVLAQAKSRR
jgi:hypothetical protein